MISTWDPNIYLRFTDHRLRPALDLMARVPLAAARTVYDLGCGPGNVTKLLLERWKGARLTGVDASPEMLEKARAMPGIAWQQADLSTWKPEAPADIIYSNAALHWLDDHASLFPRLFAQVASGGVLAVQMPRQHLNPSHRILFELAHEARWAPLVLRAIRENPVLEPGRYYQWLAGDAAEIDIWETEYLHVLEGKDAVLNWVMGSLLRPVLDRLDKAYHEEFMRIYGERLAVAYPRRADGKTLLPFRRLFVIAKRR